MYQHQDTLSACEFHYSFISQSLLQVDAEGAGYAFAVAGIGTMTVAYVTLLDEEFGIAHGTCRVGKEELLLLERHEAEEGTGLTVLVIVVVALVVVVGIAMQGEGRLFGVGRVAPFAPAVGLIALGGAVVAVDTHSTIAMVGVEGAAGTIHRYLLEVHAQAVTLCITIGEEAALQHLVG